MIKAVLFDLDGTIANSLLDLAVSVNHSLKEFGFNERDVQDFRYFAGDGMPKMIERALPEAYRDENTVRAVLSSFLKYYGVHYCDNTKPYDGITEMIDALKNRGIKVAVVTNKAQEMADRVVKKLYGDRFLVIFGKRDGIPSKPDPKSALITMSELGVQPEECIFVGDSGADIKTGVNSGAYPVGVLWGFREKSELISSGAKSIISNPFKLIEIIDKLNN